MKKLLVSLTIMAFAAAAPLAMAESDLKKPEKAEKRIHCCIKGDCKEMTSAECKKEKGKVVKDCKNCKPAKSTTKPKAEDKI
jgi:hypothetical protein